MAPTELNEKIECEGITPEAAEPKTSEAGGTPEKKAPYTVCFVCTGNTCRSPMAQAVLRAHRPDLRVLSAGIATRGGKPIAQNAATALHRAGIENTPANPYESHLSAPLDPITVLQCDKIIGLTGDHALAVLMAYPEAASKVAVFPHDIADPFGGDEETYAACLWEIEAGLREMFPW